MLNSNKTLEIFVWSDAFFLCTEKDYDYLKSYILWISRNRILTQISAYTQTISQFQFMQKKKKKKEVKIGIYLTVTGRGIWLAVV